LDLKEDTFLGPEAVTMGFRLGFFVGRIPGGFGSKDWIFSIQDC
jgi:hypothetical protein